MNKFFSKFDPISKNKWLKKINIDLKGADYNKKLISINEGITTEAIYHADDDIPNYPCKFPSTWTPYQLIDATNAKEGNKKALIALENDISGLCFSNPNNLEKLLNNISIEHIRIDFSNYSKKFPVEWASFIKNKTVKGAFHGITNVTIPNYLNTIFTKGTSKEQIINALNQGQKAKNKVQFHFTIGSNYFLEIAKLKAFRILWKNKTGKDAYIFATTDTSNKEEKFPYNNILRSTTECMSAIFGGADAIMLNPYNSTFEKSTKFSERISRNQQTILRKESYLDKTEDPTKGAYYIDYLITQLLIDFKIKSETKERNATKKWKSPEGIEIHNRYTKQDIGKIEHINFVSGIAPNLRGPYSTMYVIRPWTIRQYAGFSTGLTSKFPLKLYSDIFQNLISLLLLY